MCSYSAIVQRWRGSRCGGPANRRSGSSDGNPFRDASPEPPERDPALLGCLRHRPASRPADRGRAGWGRKAFCRPLQNRFRGRGIRSGRRAASNSTAQPRCGHVAVNAVTCGLPSASVRLRNTSPTRWFWQRVQASVDIGRDDEQMRRAVRRQCIQWTDSNEPARVGRIFLGRSPRAAADRAARRASGKGKHGDDAAD